MVSTPNLVKGIRNGVAGSLGKVDIDCGGIDGMVPEEGLEGDEVHAVLVTVRGIRMAEGMGTESSVNPEFLPFQENNALEPLLIHGFVQGPLLGEDPFLRAVSGGEGKPVAKDKVPDGGRERDIAVRAILCMPDMDALCFTVDIGIFQVAEFIEPHASGVKDGDGKECLWIFQGLQKTGNELPVRDKGEVSVKLTERDLGTVPGFMEHIDPEKL